MDSIWDALLPIIIGLIAVWIILMIALLLTVRHYTHLSLKELLRLLPNIIRLLKRLVSDGTLSNRVRVLLGLLVLYLLFPIDLVPDVIPVLGYADDAVISAIALRAVARAAGSSAISRHWPGTESALSAIFRIVGINPKP